MKSPESAFRLTKAGGKKEMDTSWEPLADGPLADGPLPTLPLTLLLPLLLPTMSAANNLR